MNTFTEPMARGACCQKRRGHGVRLVPGLYRNFPLMPRAQAEEEEARLANELRAKGYTVWQN